MAYKKSIETKKKILDAAYKLFEEKGYEKTNIKDIAKESGIVHSSIYYYFDNKENIARTMFDIKVELIKEKVLELRKSEDDILVEILVNYIMIFKNVALNRATREVYYNFVNYSEYDKDNIIRVKNSFFFGIELLFKQYNVDISDKDMIAYIVTSDAFAKALFKSIINGVLEYNLYEAMEYFCEHIIISNIPISSEECKKKLDRAFELCEQMQ